MVNEPTDDGPLPPPPRDAEPPPAVRINGYRIVREISRGGQAVVFLAVAEATGRRVAIKILREGRFIGREHRERFEREVRVLAALDHPHIVSIIDRGEAPDGSLYLVMPYIEGETLNVWMDEHTLNAASERFDRDPSRALRLFMTIADAVNAAHLRGIVHRDLKPSNIRIDGSGEPHILDFGLARIGVPVAASAEGPSVMTLTGQFLGSLPWASPEQAEGMTAKVDIRSDVYSLGVILYQMLTGQFPYEVVGSMRDVLNNIANAQPTPPSEVFEARLARAATRDRKRRIKLRNPVTEELEFIVLRALAKRREDRYQSAGELAADVGNYLSGRPTVAQMGMSSGHAARRGRRMMAIGAGIAAAAAALLVVGWVLFGPTRGGPEDGDPAADPAGATVGPGAAIESPAAEPSGEGWIDLLAETDGVPPAWTGSWSRDAATGSLTLDEPPVGGPAGVAGLSVPIDTRRGFELEVDFKRDSVDAGFGITFPAGDGRVGLILGQRRADRVPISGLISAGWAASGGWAAVAHPSRIGSRTSHKASVRVEVKGDEADIAVLLDYQPLLRWQGPTRSLSISPAWTIGSPSAIAVGSSDSGVMVSAARIRPIDRAPVIPAFPPNAIAGVGGWREYVWKRGIPVADHVNTESDAIEGQWSTQGDVGTWSRRVLAVGPERNELALPLTVDGDYDLYLVIAATPNDDSLTLALPIHTAEARLTITDVWSSKPAAALLLADGSPVANGVRSVSALPLDPSVARFVDVVVMHDRVDAELFVLINRQLILTWSGPIASLAPGDAETSPGVDRRRIRIIADGPGRAIGGITVGGDPAPVLVQPRVPR